MNEILDDLISQGKELEKSITIKNLNSGIKTTYESQKKQDYQDSLSSVKRLIKTKYPSELNDFEKMPITLQRITLLLL